MFIPNDKTFAQGCEEYLDNCYARNLRDGTIKHYKESIQQIQKYVDEDMYIKDITKETFDNYIKALRNNANLNSVSIYTYSRDFKTILNFFMRQEYLPTFKIQLMKADKQPIETYSDSDLMKLLKKPNLKKCSFTEYKNWVMVNFLLSTGIRQRSLINIQVKDVDFDNEVVNINVTKNGKPLIIPLNSDIVRILKEYLKYRNGAPETICQGLFNHLYKKTVFLLILLNFIPYHSFNFIVHSFGSLVAEMHLDYVCCLADFLSYGRASRCFLFRHFNTSVLTFDFLI